MPLTDRKMNESADDDDGENRKELGAGESRPCLLLTGAE